MSKQYISPEVRMRVAKTAKFRCGYCLTSQHIVGRLLEIDHIIPESRGGTANEENLWLACPLCNGAKSDHIEGPDFKTGQNAPLFNPRIDRWKMHFRWVEDGTRIEGLTPKGRATVDLLKMNHSDSVEVRRRWVSVGWHPPGDL